MMTTLLVHKNERVKNVSFYIPEMGEHNFGNEMARMAWFLLLES